MIDLEEIFYHDPTPPTYGGLTDEFSAITCGLRKLAVFVFPTTDLLEHPTYKEICSEALRNHLTITIKGIPTENTDELLKFSYVFVSLDSELWRIPAYIAVKAVFEQYGWCDGAEHLEGQIMGFSPTQIADWLRRHSNSRAGWSGRTVYSVISRSHSGQICDLGRRSFPLDAKGKCLIMFYNRDRDPIKEEASTILDTHSVLVRLTVRDIFFQKVFGDLLRSSSAKIIRSSINLVDIPELNKSLTSSIQFLEDGTWA